MVEPKGLASVNIVQSKQLGRDIVAGFKAILGGEIAGYSEMMSKARDTAIQHMIESGQARVANAFVNVRLTASSVQQGMLEILAYVTAVIAEKVKINEMYRLLFKIESLS